MKTLLTTLCAASLGTAPALAGITPEGFVTALQRAVAAETVEGEIRKIAEDKASFLLHIGPGQLMTVRLDGATVYTLDGTKVERDAALRTGRRSTVTHENGLASRVDVKSGDRHG
jgi:hypothetical protein